MNILHHLPQRGNLLVVPESHVLRGESALGSDSSGLDHEEAWASEGDVAQVDEVEGGQETVFS